MAVSNDVMEWEIKRLNALIARAQQAKQDSEELAERKQAVEVAAQILVVQVQNGVLDMDAYLLRLKQAIRRDQLLLQYLQQQPQQQPHPHLPLILQRLKIMKEEVTTAEENRDELED